MRISILSILLLLPLFLFAQKEKPQINESLYEDVVYLKNGSIIRGDMMEIKMGEQVRIKILGGSEFVFKADEIEKIQKEKKDFTSYNQLGFRAPVVRHIPEFNGGMYHKITTAIMPGRGTDGWGVVGVSLHYAAGYKFNQYANVGIGIGIESFIPEQIVPIYLDYRGYVGKKSAAFFYSMELGYGIGKKNNINAWRPITEARGGIMAKPAIGVRLPARKAAHFTFGLGFRFQKGSFTTEERFWDNFGNEQVILRNTNVLFQRFTFQWGMEF